MTTTTPDVTIAGVKAELRKVQLAADRRARAELAFEQRIREAAAAGAPLRAIAERAGVSHEQVRLILRGKR